MEKKTYSTPKRIRQTRQRSRTHSPALSKPHITISRRRRKNKRLRQSSQDLPKHYDSEDLGSRAGIPDPVPEQQKCGGGEDAVFRASVEQVDYHGRADGEGEEEAYRQPVYGCFGDVEVDC